MNITNINERQFNLVLNREGILVNDYYDSSKEYRLFFRRNERSTTPEGKIRLFYPQESDMKIGTLFALNGSTYVITSQDGAESNIYYTSIAIKCDTTFTFYSNLAKKYITVPFVVTADNYTIARSQEISIVAGSLVVYTGDNELVKDFMVNGYYENFGNAYTISNTFCNNGLYYVYMEQTAKRGDTYNLVYNGVVTLDRGTMDTYQLSYTAMKNGTPVTNPALVYTSSNETLATVSDTGLVTLLADGQVTITAKWLEQNVECSNLFTIICESAPSTDVWNMTISGNTRLKVGFPRTYSFNVTKNDVAATAEDIKYEIVNPSNILFATNTYDSTAHTLTLMVENEDYVDESFTINATETEHSLSASLEVAVAGLF